MVHAPTKKELEDRLEQLIKEMEAIQLARDDAAMALQAAQDTIQAQQVQLAAAQVQVDAARAQAVAAEEAAARTRAEAETAQQLQAQLHAQLQAVAAAQPPEGVAQDGLEAHLPEIPWPPGTGWSIREAMELGHTNYADIQSIRSLVIRAQLDWTDDFRRQDPDRLATFFRAARKAHPVLRHYMNNWVTAAIARQYMQNKRKHAYKQGYIKKKPVPGDKRNGPRGDNNDTMNGGGMLFT